MSTEVTVLDAFAQSINTGWGQIRLVQQVTFGDMLISFLLTIVIVLLIFGIVQKAL